MCFIIQNGVQLPSLHSRSTLSSSSSYPRDNPMVNSFQQAFSLDKRSSEFAILHTCWPGYPHDHSQCHHYFTCSIWRLVKFHEQKVHRQNPPNCFWASFPKRKAVFDGREWSLSSLALQFHAGFPHQCPWLCSAVMWLSDGPNLFKGPLREWDFICKQDWCHPRQLLSQLWQRIVRI
jgi:hypothetical protein